MALSSGISKRYKQPFMIDDDGLRRIEGVLIKAAGNYQEPLKILYHVEREDDRFFQTHDIDEVLADPNVKGRRVRLLGIELLAESSLADPEPKDGDRVAWIVFDRDQPPMPEPDTRVRIKSPDKTWALMLADEIEPQLLRLFKIKPFPTWIIFCFAPVFGLAAFRLSSWLGFEGTRRVVHGVVGAALFLLACMLIAFYNGLKHDRFVLSKFLSPEYVFLWGDEVTAYADREGLRKNILWVVLVGFFVSVVSGLATLLL